jgi:superfamily II RNA helicase
MLRIPTEVPMIENPYPFPLDDFQKKAFDAIQKNENVLVTAKTGSGKTLVGEYQILHSLNKGKRVLYTTPIKSLTNQKFHDLKQIHKSVGIMTGDIKFCPQADVVILTTEILRNLLYKQGSKTETIGITANLSLDDVDAIVFDEVHYINDTARGKVWEECFILLPPHIRMVLLSATLDHPEVFAEWLGNLKQVPVHLISTDYRVVPLYHKVGKETLMGPDNVFHRQVYTQYLRNIEKEFDAARRHKDAVRVRGEDEPVVARDVRQYSFLHRMNQTIEELERDNLLPALFFVFSRKQCVEYASKVSRDLIDSSDTASVRHILKFHLHRYPELNTLPQYHELQGMLLKGIAYHHSGLLPLLKEIVELLFARGFIKVLFATETFAVGINMPTKTVVFTSYRKFDDELDGLRVLRTDEYIQMAGRAGRRGKDDKGIVMYLPDRNPEPLAVVESMMTGKQSTVVSQMDFETDFILKTLQSGHYQWKKIFELSYWYQQAQADRETMRRGRDALLAQKPEFHPDILERAELEAQTKTKDIQRKLEAWKNKHIGPKWDAAWKTYLAWKPNEALIARFNVQLAVNLTQPIEDRIAKLQQDGYIGEDGFLTTLGILAAEINEADSLVMSKAYINHIHHTKSPIELLVALSAYIRDDVYPELVYDWMEAGDFGELCQRYELDAGTVLRFFLKLANVLEEWTNLATYCEDLEMLEKIKGLKETLVRGLVKPDSLYLHV